MQAHLGLQGIGVVDHLPEVPEDGEESRGEEGMMRAFELCILGVVGATVLICIGLVAIDGAALITGVVFYILFIVLALTYGIDSAIKKSEAP